MPTVTIGANSTDTYSGFIDCELNSFEPNTVFNGTGMNCQNDASFPNNVLVAATGISSIPGGVTITAASLKLYLDSESDSSQVTIELRRVLRNWVEGQATWNVYSTGNSWTTAGCKSDGNDRVASTSASSSTVGDGTGVYYTITGLATDVANFYNGTNNNYGWVLQCTTSGKWKNFATSSSTDGHRPYLEVTYSTGSVALGGSAGTGGTGTAVPNISVALRQALAQRVRRLLRPRRRIWVPPTFGDLPLLPA